MFVGRSLRGSLLVDAEKLMIEHPLRLHLMVRVMAHNLSSHLPGTGHVVDEIVMPLGGSLGGRTRARQRNQQGGEQGPEERGFHEIEPSNDRWRRQI